MSRVNGGAEWLSAPLLPCAETATLPAAALAATPKTTGVCAPAAKVKGLAGLVVTPAGMPDSVTCTEPLKPFSAVTITFTAALAEPCETEIELGAKARRKSGAGGGGTNAALPPPHAQHAAARNKRTAD